MTFQNSDLRQTEVDGTRDAAAAAVRAALLRDAAVEICEVSVREHAAGDPSLAAWIVPSGAVHVDRLRRLQREVSRITPWAVELIPVSTIPLSEQGIVDWGALEQIDVVDQDLLDRWESAVSRLPEIGRVAVVARQREWAEQRWHLSDLLPQWNALLAPAMPAPSLQPDEPAAAADHHSGPRPLAFSAGAARDPVYAVPSTLGDALAQTAGRVLGDRIFFVDGSGAQVALSYADLLHRAERILGGLRELGLAPGDTVILQLVGNDEILESFWGCVLGGFVPVIAAVPKAYQSSDREFQQLCRVWEAIDRPWMILPSAQVSTALHRDLDPGKLIPLESLRAHAPDHRHHTARPEDVAFFSLTSGSTGTPKSVMLTHRCILQRASGVNQLCGWGAHDVVINWLPLDHIGSISDWHCRCVPTGCTLVYVPKEYVLAKPLRWLDLIDRFRGTHSWAPNFAYSLVNRALEKTHDRAWDLSCVKTLLTAGESVSLQVVDRFVEQLAPHRLRKSVIQPVFGMAETGSGITYFQPTEETRVRIFNVDRHSLDGQLVMREAGHPDAIPFVSLGPPIPGVTIKIVDKNGETLPEQRIGQLYISGDAVSAGYFRDDTATRAVFRDDGWFDSGDLAFLSEGELIITGRAKESLIINGANFYNSEIEAAVEEVPGVSVSFCAACAVRPDATAAEALAIFFHTPASEDAHLRDLLGNIRKTLARRLGLKPDFLLPVAREDIPKSPIGKLLRSRLTKQFERGDFAAVLKRVDVLMANEHTMPDWFFRKVWRRKQSRADDSRPAFAHTWLLASESTVSQAIGARLQQDDPRGVRVEHGPRVTGGDGYVRLLQSLRDQGGFPDRIVHCWNHGPVLDKGGGPRVDHALGAAGLDLLALVRALSELKEAGHVIHLDVLASGSQVVEPHDPFIAQRAVLSGLLKTIAAEHPWLVCRHLDAPDDSRVVSFVLDEFSVSPADREVVLRAGGRFVPRLEQVTIDEASGAIPFRDGGCYVVHGGLDGVGLEIARYLVTRHGARVLVLGDSSRPDHAGAGVSPAAGVNIEHYQHPAELPQRIEDFERRTQGTLDGIIHVSALYRERALLDENRGDLDRDLLSDVEGCRHLCEIARRRASALFISFTSATGFFGGATAGAISAAASSVTARTDDLRVHTPTRCYNFAWSLWSHQAENGPGDSSVARASGFHPVSIKQGLLSCLAALRFGPGSYLIGLDAQHQRVRSKLANKPASLLEPVVCFSAPTLIAGESLAALDVRDQYGHVSRAKFQQLQEPEPVRRAQVELWPSVAEYFVYDDLLYHALAHDERRNHSYKVAIQQSVKDKVVVEIGTGKEAILARFCVEAGARKVYAIEIGDEAFRDASALVARLGLQDTIELIHGDATRVELPELADVCVSEIVGPIGGCEGAAVLINDSRRFLKPGGIMLPARSVTTIAAATLPDSLLLNPGFNEVPGSYVPRIFDEIGRPFDVRLCVKNFDNTHLISSVAVFEDLDFNRPIPLEDTHTIDIVVEKNARLDGFIVWLNLHTIAGEVIDTLQYEYCWLPVFLPVFDPGVRVTIGDRIEATIERRLCENGLNPDFRVRGRLIRANGEQLAFAHDSLHHEAAYRGTPFYRRLFSREPHGVYLDGYRRELYRKLGELPVTADGGIDRDRLPVADRAAAGSDVYIAPGTATEQKIAAIWQDILEVGQVSLLGNFFQLGGHSLLLVQMHERLREEFATPISLVELFKYPTVSSLAQFLDGGQEASSTAAAQGRVQAERRRSRRSQAAADTDIAVIGMACRFPGADDLDTFWKNLAGGVESITFFNDEEIARSGIDARTARDPNYVKASSILSDVAGFDPDFFGISTREAVLMDPQQRLFLECAWEVMEDAGYDPLTYPGLIGVYAGASMNTYLLNQVLPNRGTLDSRDDLGVTTLDSLGGFQLMIGSDKDYLPTQAAYRLNLRGPAVNVQTACSTTLVTIHLAVRSLLDGECDVCLAGGASVKVPQTAGHLFQDGMIVSPDGHCRAFDARAQGTIFGSGVGIVALKRSKDAVADGDHIYAVIKGTAINNDGATKVGYMSPSGDGQASVAAEALAVAKVSAESITYVEAHGTATELGDPIEIAGLAQAFRGERPRPHTCAVGSVKTNVGHLQIVSGVAGFIKTALALYHAKIPASLHFERPNSAIDFDSTPFYVNTALTDWTVADGPRLAGVNSLGIGGTNAHAILEEPPRRPATANAFERPAHVLALSGKTETALWQQVSRYVDHLERHHDADAANVCFTANVGRHHFDYRIAVCGRTAADLRHALAEQQRQHQDSPVPAIPVDGAKPRVVFLFTGQGAQYAGMCRELFDTQPTFRRALERCQDILDGMLDVPLLQVLYPDATANGRADLINQTAYTQPALFAVEYALAELWQSWGIRPDAVLGHSVGQYVAACVAGVFSLEDGLRLVAERGRLMQRLPNDGAMAMVHADRRALETFLGRHRDELSVAAVNSPSNTVISGSRAALERVLAQLDAAGVKWQLLATSHAFHSRLVEPMLDEFEKRAATVTFSPPGIPVISNRDGMPAGDEIATPAYWRDHAREPVEFMAGIKHLERQGHSLFVELGPHPALLTLARETWTGAGAKWLTSCRRNRSDWDCLLASVAELHVLGCSIDWHGLDRDYTRQRVRLPTYPFQHRQCWISAPVPPVEAERSAQRESLRTATATGHRLLGRRIRAAVTLYESELGIDAPAWLGDHRVFDTVVTPAAATLEMVLAAATAHFKTSAITIDNGAIHQALVLPSEGCRTVQLVLEPHDAGTATFRILALDESSGEEKWHLHMAGNVSANRSPLSLPAGHRLSQPLGAVPGREWYQQCREWGADFGPAFLSVEWLHRGPGTTTSSIVIPDHLPDDEGYGIHPILLDGALQTAVASLPEGGVHLPLSFDRLEFRPAHCRRAFCQVTPREARVSGSRQVDVELFDDHGELLARIGGLTLRRASRDAMRAAPSKANGRYHVAWKPVESTPVVSALPEHARRYLIISDHDAAAARVVERLGHWGASCTVGVHAAAFDHRSAGEFFLNLDRADDVRRMLTAVASAPERLDAVLYLSLAGGAADANAVPATAERDCGRLLNFVQAAAQLNVVNGPSLCLVTRGAQPVGDPPDSVDPVKSALWGMATVLSLEHSEWRTVLVDLDRRSWDDDLDLVVDDVLSAAGTPSGGSEDRLAYRRGKRHVARLVPAATAPRADQATIRGDATYLITGGLGGVGLKAASWLAERGAGTIVLAGRRGLHESAALDVQKLKQLGARIVIEQLDVTDAENVAALIARINLDSAPLKGVIHAAGLLDDAILMRQQPDQFARVLQPKTHGAWNLHVHTQHLALDFFVLCSSMASVTGSPGQSNYAAANAFLDGLAWYRRERDLPALSINWGIWDGIGVAAHGPASSRWQLEGFGTLTVEEALSHLDALMRSTAVQVGVSPIDVAKLPDLFKHLPLFRSIARPVTADEPGKKSFRDRLNAAPAGRRRALLEKFVQDSVAAVLGVDARDLTDRRAGFSSLGMDSLSTLELRNRLQAGLRESLPAALAFHYPNLETLTSFLATGLIDAPIVTAVEPHAALERPVPEILSRSDLDGLLAERMASLKDTLDRAN
uniref:Polyketide synthase n=1 Tax=uncultured Acidobacteria bacterium C5 TaxID=1036856 RepID=F8TTM7_9BACT|nr:polyketide synthase [uncultured Acidobacteria bacterium C5]